MHLQHCDAIFYYLPWLSKTKVSNKNLQCNVENACGNRMCKRALRVKSKLLKGLCYYWIWEACGLEYLETFFIHLLIYNCFAICSRTILWLSLKIGELSVINSPWGTLRSFWESSSSSTLTSSTPWRSSTPCQSSRKKILFHCCCKIGKIKVCLFITELWCS